MPQVKKNTLNPCKNEHSVHGNAMPGIRSFVLIENSFTAEPSVAMDTMPKGRFRKFLHTFACARESLHVSR